MTILRNQIQLLILLFVGAMGNMAFAEETAPVLPAWVIRTITRAEAYEKNNAEADYAAMVKPHIPTQAYVKPAKSRKLLVFHNPHNFRHTSEVLLRKALAEMGTATGAYDATVTDDIKVFTAENLSGFDAVMFNLAHGVSGIGQPGAEGQRALLDFVRNGGGFLAIHSAISAFGGNRDYQDMIGGSFSEHPFGGKEVILRSEVPGSPFTAGFGDAPFPYVDEIFTIKGTYSRADRQVLLSIDWERSTIAQKIEEETLAKNVKFPFREDRDYAVSWIKPYGQGRVFYTSLGHEHRTIADPRYLKHLLAAIQYACGDLPMPAQALEAGE